MSNLILLVVCFVAGLLLRQSGKLPENAHVTLNGFIIHIALPALTLLHIHGLHVDSTLIFVVAMAWLLFGLGVLFFWVLGRLAGLTRSTTGALMLTGGLGNTSFVGLPMIETFYGKEGMATGILIDQLGSYLALSTVGIVVASLYAGGRPDATTLFKKVASFPPFLALLLALALLHVDYPAWVEQTLQRLSATLAPLALFSVGMQLKFEAFQGNKSALCAGLGFKLLLAPLLLALLYGSVMGASGQVIQITLFEAAMAPMIGGAIVAMQHRLNPALCTLMIGVGIPLSFLTLPGWWYLLRLV